MQQNSKSRLCGDKDENDQSHNEWKQQISTKRV